MIHLSTTEDLKLLIDSVDIFRKNIENSLLSDKNNKYFYCSYCERVNQMTTNLKNGWNDLRGQFICVICGLNNRQRFFYNCIKNYIKNYTELDVLLFEHVTLFYERLNSKFKNLTSCEFNDYSTKSGDFFIVKNKKTINQNIQNTSYKDDCFDLILHQDVLEHVPDFKISIQETYRILKPKGYSLFSIPLFTKRNKTITRAKIINNRIIHTLEPRYHGSPLSKNGSLVFHEFGLDLFKEIKSLGINASILLSHSILNGYFSNNNPYDIGLMWPIVILIKKE
jgi:SAM-dependent methyltransferase